MSSSVPIPPPPPRSGPPSRGSSSSPSAGRGAVSSPNFSDVTMSDAEFALMDPNYVDEEEEAEDNDNDETASLLEYSDTSMEFSSMGGGGGGGGGGGSKTSARKTNSKTSSQSNSKSSSKSNSNSKSTSKSNSNSIPARSKFRNESLSPSTRVVQFNVPDEDEEKQQLVQQQHQLSHQASSSTSTSTSSRIVAATSQREPPARYPHHQQQHQQQQKHQHQHHKHAGKENPSASSSRKHRPRNAPAASSNVPAVSATTTAANATADAPASAKSPLKEHWMARLAYSFRSPEPSRHPRRNPKSTTSSSRRSRPKSSKSNLAHVEQQQPVEGSHGSMDEYPHSHSQPYVMSHANDDSAVGMTTMTTTTMTTMSKEEKAKDRHVYNNEITPLLTTTMSSASTKERARAAPPKPVVDHNNFVVVAAALLQDYEANRPPAFSSELSDITETQILLHSVKFSGPFSLLLTVATLALFVSSGFESFADSIESRIILTALNFFSLTVFGVDMWIRNEFRSSHYHYSHRHPSRPVSRGRSSRSERLIKPLMLFSIVLGLENLARLLVTRNSSLVLFSSFFKPLVLFYASSQARDALEALRRIIRIVVRVLVIELLLILMFAAVACRLFSDYDRFQDLSTSWLSLFELATTVVNPSIWMPMYEANKFSAFFFIFFIVTAVFYLHSLVLSVVFSSYIQAASEIYERSSADREDAVQLAYLALQEQQQQKTKGQSFAQEDKLNVVDISLVGETLRLVRPHYSAMKINALLEIVDPTNHKYVNYPTFRTKIRQALNASIRTARCASTLAMSIELVAVAVAVVNFCYVILVSSSLDYEWFNSAQERVGVAITLVAGFELAIRFNPLRIPDFTPLTRLNATFDGLALAAALASSIGIIMYAAGRPLALEYILMGRAIDMMRIMRFFEIFRDVVRRSADVLPALTGPIILVATTLHIFVYLGMALWGGAIHVGSHQGEITYLYDLNNFNSYQEGVVTMFQVLVVNDWHAIAEVFLYADRFSSPYIVYPFFIIGNLIGVSIMLNVLTAFFVESFVTKLDDGGADGSAEATTTVQKGRGFSILTSENASVRLVSSSSNMLGTKKTKTKIQQKPNDNGSDGDDADSEASSESEFFQFDVYEREGIDKIMQTIGGSPQSGGDFARHICNYLEIFERLSPGRETVGYLVCDQQTLERFGNRRFQTKAIGFLDENQLHLVVSDMHSELMALSSRPSFDGRSLIRTFPRQGDPSKTLEISASILRRHPALSLFVSRLRSSDGERVDQALSV